ncbi:hypothetical protein DRQ09_09350, partial [candidate division KSB1 bacterium]
MKTEKLINILKIIFLIIAVYFFLVSIKLLGTSLKMFGGGFARALLMTTSNPFTGLLIGILTTSLVQSSSMTTSIVVGLVGDSILSLRNAVPIVMGANIGTTVTNTIVSMGHITRKTEFRRAFASATVHDFFNILAVCVLFPLEVGFHIIEKSAVMVSKVFSEVGGTKIFDPIKVVVNPIIYFLKEHLHSPLILLIIAILLLFFSLTFMIRVIRSLILKKMEIFLNKYLFKSDLTSFILGIIFTAIVQSSSITTSLVVPLAGAGILTVRKIFPYTLGANIGTTVTALLASFATFNPVAVTVAFSHLLFNIFGIIIFYPLNKIPVSIAEGFAKITTRSKRNTFLFVILYFSIYIL